MPSRRPNILLVMYDQLSAQSLAAYGHPLVRTPHLDSLAADGVVFDAAYCASPLCGPSRFAMMAGRLGSAIGAHDNASEFRAEVPTFCHYLRRAGYRTSLSGKMHFVGPDQLHGYEERLTTDMYPADFGWANTWREPEKRLFWHHNMQSVVEAGVYERTLEIDYDEEVGHQATRRLYDFGREREDHRPWFMTVSFMHPHDPFMTPREHWERYRHDDIDMPRVAPLPDAQMHPHDRRLRRLYAVDEYALSDEHVRNARHAYYGMIAWGDDRLGELLRVLDVTGMRDDTIVIVTADHGEMLGEHGLWYKMSFRERSARVPLVVTAPERFARRRVAEPVSHLDLLPTLLALAGGGEADLASMVDGVSLLPSLDGDSLDREYLPADYCGEGVVAPMFMLRRGPLKYIACGDDPPQLFDLGADPDEQQNLAAEPSHAQTVADFAAEVGRRWDAGRITGEVLESQACRLFVHEAGLAGKPPRWDFQPFEDAGLRYNRNIGGEMYDTDRDARIPRREPPSPGGPGAA